MKIVIVEDEALTAFTFKKFLEENQHEVVGLASRTSMAIEIIEEVDPDLVILDINLKGSNPNDSQMKMTGVDLCRWIKSRSEARVLVVSAYISTPGTTQELELARADGFLSKPTTDVHLLEAINNILSKNRKL